MRITGHYETTGTTKHFIPNPLPPQDPPLRLDENMWVLYGDTLASITNLNGKITTLPGIKHFIKAYAIKEALLSSSIEGINTTMLDVFTQPFLETKPNKETQLVVNYTKALDAAVTLIKKEGLPISSRVILKAHEVLMQIGEGDRSNPGHYRKQTVKVGQLVPPPALQVPNLMADLERFINTDYSAIPPLLKAGLAHVQFETIHPFLDGNGRIGRLLIVLILINSGLLTAPILYPSYYFKKNHTSYYHWLDSTRTEGNFEGWLVFYLKVMRDSCIDAYRRAEEIEKLNLQLMQTITTKEANNIKRQESRLKALAIIFDYPVINVSELEQQLNMTYNTAHQIIKEFMDMGFLVEQTQQQRNRLYKFEPYIVILEKEYDI